MKAKKRKLAMGGDRMYELRDEQGTITQNMAEIVNVAEQCHIRLYTSGVRTRDTTESTRVTYDVPLITTKRKRVSRA